MSDLRWRINGMTVEDVSSRLAGIDLGENQTSASLAFYGHNRSKAEARALADDIAAALGCVAVVDFELYEWFQVGNQHLGIIVHYDGGA